MKVISILKWASVSLALIVPASAETISFRGKTITAIIGYAPGGGTDVVGRLFATFIAKHLPGSPNVVVQNLPGADGIIALNYLRQQVRPDGLTISISASPTVDPLNVRKKQADRVETPVAIAVQRRGPRGDPPIALLPEISFVVAPDATGPAFEPEFAAI